MSNETKKQRVALLFPEQVYPGKLGATRTLLDLAMALGSKGYKTKVFSLGLEERHISEGVYEEVVVKSKISSDSRTKPIKLVDYLYLATLGTQHSYNIMNNSKELAAALEEYEPSIIITLGRLLADFTTKYKGSHEVVCIAVTDDFRVVENSLEIRLENSKREDDPIKRALIAYVSGRFRRFSWGVYSRMVNGSDAVVFLTATDKKLSSSRFKELSGKFLVMPTAACPPEYVLNGPANEAKGKINKILFIGNARHEPNQQAMEIIEKRIAPHLKDRRFIIIGSGMGARVSGNVEYMGFLSDEEKFRIIDEADLCIAPLMKGSGIKVKMLDYFMRCKPVLASSLAFEGYDVKNGVNGVVEDNPERYAEQIMRLERDPALRNKLGTNAGMLCAYFSYDNIGDKWDQLLIRLSNQTSNKK